MVSYGAKKDLAHIIGALCWLMLVGMGWMFYGCLLLVLWLCKYSWQLGCWAWRRAVTWHQSTRALT